MAAGTTASSRRTVPPFTSPTSNATHAPRFSTRRSSRNTSAIAACQRSTRRRFVMWTSAGLMPQNQHRSQLSIL